MDSPTDIPSPLAYSEAERQRLIALARESIQTAILARKPQSPREETPASVLLNTKATFVTLTLDGRLRGCVGNLIAREPLYQSVMHNAVGAALRDTRFNPLTLEESARIKIHISVLTPLQSLQFESTEELLNQLSPGKDGVLREDSHLPASGVEESSR